MERDCLSRKLTTSCYPEPDSTSMLVSLNTLLWSPRATTTTFDETSESTGSDSEQSSSTGQSSVTDDELNNGINELTVDCVGGASLKAFSEINSQNVVFGESSFELSCDDVVESDTAIVEGDDTSCHGDNEESVVCDISEVVEPEFVFGDQLVDVTESGSGFYLSEDDDVSTRTRVI